MTPEEALLYIHKTKWLGSKPGLSRTKKLLSLMGDPQKELNFVHVAGTNGKGSTCAFIDGVLREAGLKTGLYTSPYINVFNERMRVMGEMISDDELCELLEFVKPFADSMTEDQPTEFELITALAMEYFRRQKCDVVVLEVGMGGELDSTNVIENPPVCVITAIDFDHTAFLGDTIEQIAAAKAGIIKKGSRVVAYDMTPSIIGVLEEKCVRTGATLCKADFSKLKVHGGTLGETSFDYGDFKNLKISLAGVYQPKNAAVALEACLALRNGGFCKITDKNIYEGLAKVKWPGRFEILGKEPIFVLDGAHNPHGMRGTADSIREHFGDGKKIHFLVGAMADKDVKGMMSMLLPFAEDFVAVRPDNDRAMEAEKLAELLRSIGGKAEYADSVEKGVAAVIDRAGKNGICVCVGSLYFSGEIRRSYLSLKKER